MFLRQICCDEERYKELTKDRFQLQALILLEVLKFSVMLSQCNVFIKAFNNG